MTGISTKKISAEAGGPAIFAPGTFLDSSPDESTVVHVFGDEDVSVVVWNLEPGQSNKMHTHPKSAHVQVVLLGEGEYTQDGVPPRPIKEGDWLVVPRNAVHGIRNTGITKLSYLAVTTASADGYVRQLLAEK